MDTKSDYCREGDSRMHAFAYVLQTCLLIGYFGSLVILAPKLAQ